MTRSIRRPVSRDLSRFLAPALAFMLSSGCFRGEDVTKMFCVTDENCPAGYICTDSSKPGGCQKTSSVTVDGGGIDAIDTFDGAVGVDGEVGMDGVVRLDSGVDGNAAGVDQGVLGGVDGSSGSLDTSIVVDAPLVDAPADSPLPSVDSAPIDTYSDAPAVEASAKAVGTSCQGGSECASTYCVDGVCCDGTCTGQCQACAEQNRIGTCATVSGAPRGTRPACTGTQAPCAGQCEGTLPSQCTYAAGETACAAATCSGDLAVQAASLCDGAGACTAGSVVKCDSGKYCTGSACVSQLSNGGACQNSNQCTSGNCTNSLCCNTGQTGCGSTCVSLSSNSSNCGTCGRACGAGSSCSGGSCYLGDGQPCSTGSQCLSGACTPFYVDSDGDTYGVGAATSLCGITPPSGYATRGGDCCDSNAAISPGATGWFTSAATCGTTTAWDYDCSGTVEKSYQISKCVGATVFPDCGTIVYSAPPDSACGTTPGLESCTFTSSSVCTLAGTIANPLGCH